MVFEVLAGQFYLFDHARYRDWGIVTSQKEVEEIVELEMADEIDVGGQKARRLRPVSAQQKKRARELAVIPAVRFPDDQTAEVSIVLFSKWGGFSRRTFRISRAFPHRILEAREERLVEYDCGKRY